MPMVVAWFGTINNVYYTIIMGWWSSSATPLFYCNISVNYFDKMHFMFFGILQRGMAGKSVFWDRETAIGSADIGFLDVKCGILVGNLRRFALQFAAYWSAIWRILVTNLPYIGHVPHAGRKGRKAERRLSFSPSTTCAKRSFSRYLRPRAESVANTPLLHREFSELSWQISFTPRHMVTPYFC